MLVPLRERVFPWGVRQNFGQSERRIGLSWLGKVWGTPVDAGGWNYCSFCAVYACGRSTNWAVGGIVVASLSWGGDEARRVCVGKAAEACGEPALHDTQYPRVHGILAHDRGKWILAH
jgi:hypothetical protein